MIQLRKDAGLRICDLAYELCIEANYLSKVELGRIRISMQLILMYYEYFGVSVDWMFGRTLFRDGHYIGERDFSKAPDRELFGYPAAPLPAPDASASEVS